jgi:hypothetical protein
MLVAITAVTLASSYGKLEARHDLWGSCLAFSFSSTAHGSSFHSRTVATASDEIACLPSAEKSTGIMSGLLRSGTPYTPDDLEALTRAEQERREGDVMGAMFRAFEQCAAHATRL